MRSVNADSAERILDVAERFVQTRGFNAFSYSDVAATLGVTSASLHYHFKAKADLGARLIARYTESFLTRLAEIDRAGNGVRARLAGYVGIYEDVLRANRMCLCGMLAADYATLPKPMQAGVRRFFDANEAWLSATLAEGRKSGVLKFSGAPPDAARAFISSLEGAMLLARSFGDATRFDLAASRALAELGVRRR